MNRSRRERRAPIFAAGVLGLALSGCRSAPALGSQPIPAADRAPWQRILGDSAFSIAMDTAHLTRGPDGAWVVWYVTKHARPQGSDSMRFDRGRLSLLVRCDPPAFKSLSEELALGESHPVFRQEWPVTGPDSARWRTPEPRSTDAEMLSATCAVAIRRKGAA